MVSAISIKKKHVEVLLIIVLFLIAFAPAFAFMFSILGLIVLGYSNVVKPQVYLYILGFCGFFGVVISAASQPLFLYTEADFTSYYDNYLMFLDNGFSLNNFYFGAGVEVGVPLINWLLALFIDAPMPYMVKLFHAFFQTFFLFICVWKIGKFHNLKYSQLAVLLGLTLLFFKYASTLNHLRQGYSSLFIMMGLFSRGNKSTYFVIACLFHVSAVVVYPILSFFLMSKDTKKLFKMSFIFWVSGILLFTILGVMADFIVNSKYQILGKLVWAFSKATEIENVVTSIKGTIFAAIYFLPLIIIGIYAKFFLKKSVEFNYNITSMVSFLLAFSFLPGLTVRLLSSVLLFFMGYIYFIYLGFYFKLKQLVSVSLCLLLFFMANWIFFSPLYFYNYPIISYSPFYYVPSMFTKVHGVDRLALPSQVDIKIINPNQL